MSTTVRELAALVGGEVIGDGGREILAARPFVEATDTDITFIDVDRRAPAGVTCAAAAVVVPAGVTVDAPALVRAADPFAAFVAIACRLHAAPESVPHGIDPRAAVDPTAVIGPGASIHPFAVVGAGAVIGARCLLHAGSSVGRDCRLGDDVTLHPHAVLYDRTVLG